MLNYWVIIDVVVTKLKSTILIIIIIFGVSGQLALTNQEMPGYSDNEVSRATSID